MTGVESAAKSRIRQVQGESLDHIAGGEPVTFINMDVEGAERQALDGCREVIERDKPKLLIAAYHRSEDLFAIPLQIARMNPEYRFYLRTLPLYSGMGHQPLLRITGHRGRMCRKSQRKPTEDRAKSGGFIDMVL